MNWLSLARSPETRNAKAQNGYNAKLLWLDQKRDLSED